MQQPRPLVELIAHLRKFPSIGQKSAQRLAFFLLAQPTSWIDSFIKSLKELKEKVSYCQRCYNITYSRELCPICADTERDQAIMGVVADPRDILALENSREFKGIYHVLGGLISPLDGLTPDVLKIKELIERIKAGSFREIFFAINPTVEGEATILYIKNLLKDYQGKITRIAYGLPIGGDIDYADELTIARAYEGRIEI